MRSLLGYMAGGLAVLFAMDYAAPPAGTGLNAARQGSWILRPTGADAVNRVQKGNRLAVARSDANLDKAIASVEVVGLPAAAVIYRTRDGRVLFRTDPLANATIVAKGVALPEVTIRETRQTAVKMVPATVETEPLSEPILTPGKKLEPKIPEGCDPAFSPLAASARASNFSARCLAAIAPLTRMASAD
jgi:hypothetical protein